MRLFECIVRGLREEPRASRLSDYYRRKREGRASSSGEHGRKAQNAGKTENESGDSCSTCDSTKGKGVEERMREETLAQMHKVAHDMRVKWAEWDRGTGGFEVTFEIRELRERFGALLQQWYELRGAENRVRDIVTRVGDLDLRIARLNEMVEDEITRWEHDVSELWDKWREGGGENDDHHKVNTDREESTKLGHTPAKGPQELRGLAQVATCAADMSVELDIYRTTHVRVVSVDQKKRLENVTEILNSIDHRYKLLEQKYRRKRDREHLYSAYSTFSRRGTIDFSQDLGLSTCSSGQFGTFAEYAEKHQQGKPATYADAPSTSPQSSEKESTSSSPSFSDLSVPADEQSESTLRPEAPQKDDLRAAPERTKQARVTRSTLHEKPSTTLGTSRPKSDDSSSLYDQLPSSPRRAPSGSSSQVVPPNSFSASLYQTVHRRQHSVQDLGGMLRPSKVKGDGRCMFRAVAKSRAAATGQLHNWSEEMERHVADIFRSKVCDALLQHRHLLQNYFVVEGNFDEYVRRMRKTKKYGGEPELLMLARILHVPISVYMRNGRNYKQIQVYGRVYQGTPVFILLQGDHYDCLLLKQHQQRRVYTHLSQYREDAKNLATKAKLKSSRTPSDLSKKSLASRKSHDSHSGRRRRKR